MSPVLFVCVVPVPTSIYTEYQYIKILHITNYKLMACCLWSLFSNKKPERRPTSMIRSSHKCVPVLSSDRMSTKIQKVTKHTHYHINLGPAASEQGAVLSGFLVNCCAWHLLWRRVRMVNQWFTSCFPYYTSARPQIRCNITVFFVYICDFRFLMIYIYLYIFVIHMLFLSFPHFILFICT